jgi:cell division septation protein DedD
VTEPHEPSYYEIALTNRQVVTAFVILLVCLLAAFFSGIWVGRGGAGPAEEQVQAAAPAPPREAADLEELRFFSEEGKKAGAPPAAQPSAPPTTAAPPPSTLREELERRAPQREEGAAPGAQDEAGDTEDRVAPVPEPARKAAPPAPAEPARTTPAGTVVIQVFSSAEEDQATRVRDRLAASGYKAYLSPVDVGGRTMYRVRIGPFTSRDKAQEVAERVRKAHHLDTWVTE